VRADVRTVSLEIAGLAAGQRSASFSRCKLFVILGLVVGYLALSKAYGGLAGEGGGATVPAGAADKQGVPGG
jgi:hypothetical protein